MTRLTMLPLGRKGLDYIDYCLDKEPGLCTKVRMHDLSRGNVYGLVPEGTTVERATKFDTGGLVADWRDGSLLVDHDPFTWLTDYLKQHFTKSPGASFVLQAIWAKASDPAYVNAHLPKFTNDGCIYYLVEKGNLDDSTLDNAETLLVSRLLEGFLCDLAVPRDVIATHIASDSLIDGLASNLRDIVTRAYDDESFVIWRP